jgi:hypothetical protein
MTGSSGGTTHPHCWLSQKWLRSLWALAVFPVRYAPIAFYVTNERGSAKRLLNSTFPKMGKVSDTLNIALMKILYFSWIFHGDAFSILLEFVSITTVQKENDFFPPFFFAFSAFFQVNLSYWRPRPNVVAVETLFTPPPPPPNPRIHGRLPPFFTKRKTMRGQREF